MVKPLIFIDISELMKHWGLAWIFRNVVIYIRFFSFKNSLEILPSNPLLFIFLVIIFPLPFVKSTLFLFLTDKSLSSLYMEYPNYIPASSKTLDIVCKDYSILSTSSSFCSCLSFHSAPWTQWSILIFPSYQFRTFRKITISNMRMQ